MTLYDDLMSVTQMTDIVYDEMRNNVASETSTAKHFYNNNRWLITGDWWLISLRMSDENGFNRQFLIHCLYYPSVSRQRESRTPAARVQWAAIHKACRPDRRGRRHRREGSGSASPSRCSPQNLCQSACRDAVRTRRVLWVTHLSTEWTRTALQTRRSLSRATGAARSQCADIRCIWPHALWTCAPAPHTEPISIRGCGSRWLSRVAYLKKSGHSASALLARSGTLRYPCKSVLQSDLWDYLLVCFVVS